MSVEFSEYCPVLSWLTVTMSVQMSLSNKIKSLEFYVEIKFDLNLFVLFFRFIRWNDLRRQTCNAEVKRVHNTFLTLKTRKASELDGIPVLLKKKFTYELAPNLIKLFQLS